MKKNLLSLYSTFLSQLYRRISLLTRFDFPFSWFLGSLLLWFHFFLSFPIFFLFLHIPFFFRRENFSIFCGRMSNLLIPLLFPFLYFSPAFFFFFFKLKMCGSGYVCLRLWFRLWLWLWRFLCLGCTCPHNFKT